MTARNGTLKSLVAEYLFEVFDHAGAAGDFGRRFQVMKDFLDWEASRGQPDAPLKVMPGQVVWTRQTGPDVIPSGHGEAVNVSHPDPEP